MKDAQQQGRQELNPVRQGRGAMASLTVAQALTQAIQQFQAGNLAGTEQLVRAILQVDPYHVEALHLLGVIAYQVGQHEQAVTYIRQTLQLQPRFTAAHNTLGVILQAQGKSAEALACYREALRLKPDYAEAHNNLGIVLQSQGQLAEAQASFQRAVRLRPNYAEAQINLGVVYLGQGQLAEAQTCFEQAIRSKADYAVAYNNLGNVLTRQGKTAEAVAHLQQALRLQPNYPEAHDNLGVALQAQGQLAEALACHQQALRLRPNFVEAHNNLGNVLRQQGQIEEAEASFQQALRLRPAFVEAHVNLGMTLQELGRSAEAAEAYDQALQLRPSASLRILRATLLPPIYASADEVSAWRTKLQDNLAQLHHEQVMQDLTQETARPLFYLAYQGLDDRDLQLQAAQLYRAPSPSGRHPRRGDGRIRIGFVSRHLREHTIGELFRGLITQLDRTALAVTVFSLGRHPGATSQFLRANTEAYVELPINLSVAREQIAAHELDVLIYPDIGMEELTYSLAFSRLAPVQAVLWGHPVTTGIANIDYFLSSELLETPGAEQHYTETLVRLPTLPVYYYRPQSPNPLQGRAAFGLPEDAHLYGCPQSLFKLHPEFDGILRDILRRDPRGMVVLLEGKYKSWAEAMRQRFAATLGEAADRIHWVGRVPRAMFLNLNALMDVLLDPIHFGGGNTSYEALAFGVPIVTLPSGFLRGRITLALYRQMQMLDCVAADVEEYIDKAVRLGTDAEYRAHISAKIQEANTVLYENLAGVRAFEAFVLSVARPA
jgi:predicted O-linked N-acetylglucosamine transferase (SPINDLY family)